MSRHVLAAALCVVTASPLHAQTPDARRAELLRQRAAIDAELQALDSPAPAPAPSPLSGDVVVTGRALSLTTRVTGQTVTTVDDDVFRNTPATTIADIVRLAPGVAVIQGNGRATSACRSAAQMPATRSARGTSRCSRTTSP